MSSKSDSDQNFKECLGVRNRCYTTINQLYWHSTTYTLFVPRQGEVQSNEQVYVQHTAAPKRTVKNKNPLL
jgi:hypothetical protein